MVVDIVLGGVVALVIGVAVYLYIRLRRLERVVVYVRREDRESDAWVRGELEAYREKTDERISGVDEESRRSMNEIITAIGVIESSTERGWDKKLALCKEMFTRKAVQNG